jgi:hypothetical protein
MSAAVEFASAMETATSVEGVSTAHLTACESASVATVVNSARAAIVPMSPARPAVPVTPEPRRMAPVIPRANADKHSIHEILRPIVAIRRTSVRIIAIISVRTGRWPSHISRADSDSDSYSNLRLRIRKRHHQNRQQRHIFQVSHSHLQLPEPPSCFSSVPEALQSLLLIETTIGAKSCGNRSG